MARSTQHPSCSAPAETAPEPRMVGGRRDRTPVDSAQLRAELIARRALRPGRPPAGLQPLPRPLRCRILRIDDAGQAAAGRHQVEHRKAVAKGHTLAAPDHQAP